MLLNLLTLLALTSLTLSSITQLNFGSSITTTRNRGERQDFFLDYYGDEPDGPSYIQCTARSINTLGVFRLSLRMGQSEFAWPLPTGFFSSNATVSSEEMLAPAIGRWYLNLNACGNCREWTSGSATVEVRCDLVPFGEQMLQDGVATTRVIGRGLTAFFFFDVVENDYAQFFELDVVANISNALRVSYSRSGYPVGNNYERILPSSGWTNVSTFNNQPQISSVSSPGRYFVRVETCGNCSPFANGGYIEFNITHTIRTWGKKDTRLGPNPIFGHLPESFANYYWIDLPVFRSLSITAHPESPLGGQYRLCISRTLPSLNGRASACTGSYTPTPTLDYLPQNHQQGEDFNEFGRYIIGIFQCPSCRFPNGHYPGYHINATFLEPL